MSARQFVLAGIVSAFALPALLGCATDGAKPIDRGVDENTIATPDAGADGSVDAADAGPCADCEYFPETCSSDILCPDEPVAATGKLDPRAQVSIIRGRSATDVWLAGALGMVAHFDGTSWTRSDIEERESIRDLWLGSGSEVSFVALERQFSRGLDIPDGGSPAQGWQTRPAPTWPTEYADWKRVLHSTWASPGSQWIWGATEETACQASYCITNPDSDAPALRAFNTQTWRALHAVWAASDTDVWAVGANGIVRHYTGHAFLWDIVSKVPTTKNLNAVWGSSSSDVWVVGDGATVFHYDGETWTRVKIAGLGGRRPKLTTVWVASPGHVWVGGQGVVLSLGGKP